MSQIGIKLFGQQQQTSIPYLSSRMCPRSSLKGFYFDIQGVNQSCSACKLSHCHRWDCLKNVVFHLPSCCLTHTLFLFESLLKMPHVFLDLLKENKNFKHTLGMLNREPHLKEKNKKRSTDWAIHSVSAIIIGLISPIITCQKEFKLTVQTGCWLMLVTEKFNSNILNSVNNSGAA